MIKDNVKKQYNNWVYPDPINDLNIAINNGYWEIGDPELYWPIFWPDRRNTDHLDILVAGCGSNQAAYYAYQNPSWNVVGIDLSETSLANQIRLKEKHRLKNLRLINLDLYKVRELGETFDFITSTGVLHHLPSPQKGLIELKHVLRQSGVINLMLYGKSLRLGVYVLQEFFREIGLKQSSADLEVVKESLKLIPNDHIVNRYMLRADDLTYDAGIVDTFLHQVDQAYWVKEIFELVEAAGLNFLSWCDPGEYALENVIPESHPLWTHIKDLEPEKTAHLYDLFMLDRGTHRFAVAHPEYVQAIKINYHSDQFFDCYVVAHRNTEILSSADYPQKKNARIKRDQFEYELDYELARIMALTNAEVSIGQAIELLGHDPNMTLRCYQLAKEGFQQLAKLGHIYILK
jgi:SAM-dependent methyltransferase